LDDVAPFLDDVWPFDDVAPFDEDELVVVELTVEDVPVATL